MYKVLKINIFSVPVFDYFSSCFILFYNFSLALH
nr:MAG TPA: hypothetical protein [Caudoviricetes sp.]